MATTKVSVVMPNYNCEKYIWEAIESILNQSFTDFEFIIIDDGSTDSSWEIIQGYASRDERIVAVKNEENLGVTKTRNKLLKLVKTEYVAMSDSDDIAEIEWLKRIYTKISSDEKLWVVWTNFNIIDSKSVVTGERIFPHTNEECKESIWYRNPFWQNTVIIKMNTIKDVWDYDESYKNTEDLNLWVRIWSKYDFYNIQEKLVKYRIHWENTILKQQKLMIQNTLKVRRNAVKLWYNMPLKWKVFYAWTWCMQFVPSKIVLWIFNLIRKS